MMHLLNNFLRGILCAVLLSFTVCTAGNSERVKSPENRKATQSSASVATSAVKDRAAHAVNSQRSAKSKKQHQKSQEQQKGNSKSVESSKTRKAHQSSTSVATRASLDAFQQRLAKLEQTQEAATHFNIWHKVIYVLLFMGGLCVVYLVYRRFDEQRKMSENEGRNNPSATNPDNSYEQKNAPRIKELEASVSQLKSQVMKLEKQVNELLKLANVPTATKSGIQPTGAKITAVPTQQKNSVSSSITTTPQQTGAAQPQKSHETVKQKVIQQPKVTKLYAASCSSNILTEISGAPQENSAFVITLKNPNTAEFDIVSIDKIKSRNNLDEVVDYYGEGCTLSEATHYEVKQIGTCENTQQNCWQVTRKLQINISK